MKTTIGIRNNNPGNIRKGEPWKGLACVQDDPDFCVFKSMHWGVRALVITLRTYVVVHKLHTIEQIIGRWAPTNENHTALYIQFVKSKFFVLPLLYPEDFYNRGSEQLYTLCKAICEYESKYFLPLWQFEEVCMKINNK